MIQFMKVLKTSLAMLFLALVGLAASGCTTMAEPEDTAVPWGRPHSWEQKAPGMGM